MFVLLARCTRNELARQVQYLKVENSILREKIDGPVRLTDQERARLLKYAQHIPGNIQEHLISIVHYKTVQRWVREAKGHVPKPRPRNGRPPIKEEIVKLTLRLAKETGWGYTRIKGELIKLGHADVGRTTIAKVVKEAGLDPGPDRGPTQWDHFIKRHASTLWAADFLSVKAWTKRGKKGSLHPGVHPRRKPAGLALALHDAPDAGLGRAAGPQLPHALPVQRAGGQPLVT